MPSNHFILCHTLLLPPSIFPRIRVFSSESVLCIRWPKYWSLSFSISPSVRELCNFLSSISSQQKFEVTAVKTLGGSQLVSQLLDRSVLQISDRSVLQLRVTAQFYLENKGKYILEAWGHADPKDTKRRGEMPLPFGSSFYVDFFSSLRACSMYTGLARSAVCSTWGPHSDPWTFLCSSFTGFSLPCLLATTILDSFFPF